MTNLATGATYPGLPAQFAYPAALGDLVTAILAIAAIPGVRAGTRAGVALAWVFNAWGTADLLLAVFQATVYGAADYMGPAYWIPAFWVPALLITHYLAFVVLWRHRTQARPATQH